MRESLRERAGAVFAKCGLESGVVLSLVANLSWNILIDSDSLIHSVSVEKGVLTLLIAIKYQIQSNHQ